MDAPLAFHNVQEWRAWLATNHNLAPEAYLLHYKKKLATGLLHRDAVDEALCFGWIDGKLKSLGDGSFVIRYTPRRAGSLWSLINRARAEEMIRQGRMTAAGLAKINEAKETGLWDAAYTDKVEREMPADLRRALAANPRAARNFAGFATSYRNMLVRYVSEARQAATREKRIAEVLRRAVANIRRWQES